MPFYMVSTEEIQKMIDENIYETETHDYVMQHILKMTKGPYTAR